VHNPVLSIVIRGVKRLVPDVTPWMAMFMISSIALGAGVVFWRLYERPALRYARSWVRERFGIGREYEKKIAA
jgi:peptidoglycan/LPS O-acetylase OafA/YrhL